MGRRSISGGVRPKGRSRIQFDFEYQGVRYRPAIDRIPTEANLRRARVQLQAINERIVKGTFDFAEEFPDYPFLAEIGAISARRTCNDVFDAFMSHAESRLAQNDLTFATVESYRKILDSVWRNTNR